MRYIGHAFGEMDARFFVLICNNLENKIHDRYKIELEKINKFLKLISFFILILFIKSKKFYVSLLNVNFSWYIKFDVNSFVSFN